MRVESFLLHPEVRVAFTGRAEANQAVHTGLGPESAAAARAAVAEQLGLGPERLRYMSQVHSARVALVAPPGEAVPEADALLDPTGALAPVVLTADCLPLAFAARVEGQTVLAVTHAGRPGLLAGVVQATLAELEARGAQRIEAWIGPAVCGACYEVPAAMQEEAEALLPGISSTTTWGTAALDLPGAAERILQAAGVTVHRSHECTLEDRRWFSYRGGDARERNATLAWVTPEA